MVSFEEELVLISLKEKVYFGCDGHFIVWSTQGSWTEHFYWSMLHVRGNCLANHTKKQNERTPVSLFFGMAVKDSDVLDKSWLCFSATICKMRITFTSHWNVAKNSNCTVMWTSNVLWHILLRLEKSCYSQTFHPRQPELLIQSRLLPQMLTNGIVSQQDQLLLQSESPDIETVASLCSTFHPHQDVSEVTGGISMSIHSTQQRSPHVSHGTVITKLFV